MGKPDVCLYRLLLHVELNLIFHEYIGFLSWSRESEAGVESGGKKTLAADEGEGEAAQNTGKHQKRQQKLLEASCYQ